MSSVFVSRYIDVSAQIEAVYMMKEVSLLDFTEDSIVRLNSNTFH